MLSTIGVVLIVILIILVLLAVGGAGLLLLAYGLGLLVTRFTHFEPFQATVLALVAILAAGVFYRTHREGDYQQQLIHVWISTRRRR